MADTAASTQSRTTRASSTKRRTTTVSTETENKLARAARSAQRLALLSDASRDGSTLDMFPDDPTRATLEAMNIDIRQGTLHGFELPDVVLAAVGASTGPDGAAGASPEAKAARRAPREKVEPAYATVPLDGFERIEPTQEVSMPKDAPSTPVGSDTLAREKVDDSLATTSASQTSEPATPTLISPSMAAASLIRSVTAARRQAANPLPVPTDAAKPAGVAPQRFAATFAKAATASRETAAMSGEASDGATAVSTTAQIKPSSDHVAGVASPSTTTAAARAAGFAGSAGTSARTDAERSAPELDRARATAFADTVDALYGVISDQRRAATDHSRRMKWMLSIVVGALLATVAIGIAQTVLLMRLTRETTAQQHRIEQLMQNQQAAMTSLLDAHLAAASTAAAVAAPSVASTPATTPRAPAMAPAASVGPVIKRKAHAHTHKPKAMPTH